MIVTTDWFEAFVVITIVPGTVSPICGSAAHGVSAGASFATDRWARDSLEKRHLPLRLILLRLVERALRHSHTSSGSVSVESASPDLTQTNANVKASTIGTRGNA